MSEILNNTKNPSREAISSFLKVCQLLEVNEFSYCGLPIPSQDADCFKILFSSALTAKKAACLLGSNWDGVNAVTIYQPDPIAVQNALDSLKLELGQEEVEFCRSGEYCYLPAELKKHLLARNKRSFDKSLKISALLMQGLEGEIENITLEIPR